MLPRGFNISGDAKYDSCVVQKKNEKKKKKKKKKNSNKTKRKNEIETNERHEQTSSFWRMKYRLLQLPLEPPFLSRYPVYIVVGDCVVGD
jgi:hypothetical protein